MYESEAYEILHLKRGSSQEEIKEAYAALSKQYHPEEHPEEFQKIHEAYMTLRRSRRRQRTERQNLGSEVKTNPSEATETFTEESFADAAEESGNQDISGKCTESEAQAEAQNQAHDTEAASQYRFDEVIEENERKDEQLLILLIQKALVEMEMLLKPQYCDKLKLFQQFFKKPEYQTALKQPAFMAYFADMLAKSHLKPMIYDEIIEFYRFRGLNPEDMYEEAAKLYYVLDDKRGMKKKKPGIWQGVLWVAAIVGIRAGTRSAKPGTGAGNFFGFLFVVVIVIALIFILYRQLYKNHSSLFAQAMVALLLTISQFVILIGDFYAPLMGSDAGTLLSLFLFLMGGIWLIGIGIAAIIKKIRRRSHR